MLRRAEEGSVTIWFEGRALRAQPEESVATALLANGITTTRTTAVSGAPRGAYCLMGACYECLAIVDGRGGMQTCLTPVREGMRVERQAGANAMLSGVANTG
jgi:predicted molibdopterin-dependent oxidoreductase YjgC